MRKLLNKKKEIKQELNEKKEYLKFLWAVGFAAQLIREIFNISYSEMVAYAEKGKNLIFENELLKEEWYPKLSKTCKKITKLAYKFREKKDLLKAKELEKETLIEIEIKIRFLDKVYIKERKLRDLDFRKIVSFLATYIVFTEKVIGGKVNEYLSKNELKEIKTFITQSKTMFSAILHDIDNYKGFYYKEK